MLQINVIRAQTERVLEGLKKRHFKEAEVLIAKVIDIDKQRREVQLELDNLKAKSNTDSKRVGELMKAGKQEEAQAVRAAVTSDKDNMKALEDTLQESEKNFNR